RIASHHLLAGGGPVVAQPHLVRSVRRRTRPADALAPSNDGALERDDTRGAREILERHDGTLRMGGEVQRADGLSVQKDVIAVDVAPSEIVKKSRSTQRPQRPQRRNAQGLLSVLCELC